MMGKWNWVLCIGRKCACSLLHLHFRFAVVLQDLNKLQSVFTTRPWRQGCIPLLSFLFRTKAAAAYNTDQAAPSSRTPCRVRKSLPQAVAALVAAEVRGGSIMGSRQDADSQDAADGEQKGSTCADKSVTSSSMIDEIEQGAVVVTVRVSSSHASGSEDSSSSGQSVSSASEM